MDPEEVEEVNTDTLFSQEETDDPFGESQELFSDFIVKPTSPEEETNILASLGQPMERIEAKSFVADKMKNRLTDFSVLEGNSIQQYMDNAEQSFKKSFQFQEAPAFTVAGAAAIDNPNMDSVEAAYEHNRERAGSLLSERMDNRSGWWSGYVFDLLDYYGPRLPADIYESFSERDRKLTEKFVDLFYRTDPKEFDDKFTEVLDEIEREGVLTGNNFFAWARVQQAIANEGFNPGQFNSKLLSSVDLLGSVGTAARLLRKGGIGAASVGNFARRNTLPYGTGQTNNAVAQAARSGGSHAADEAWANIERVGPNARGFAANQAQAGPGVLNPHPTSVRGSLGTSVKKIKDNLILRMTDYHINLGTFGRAIDTDEIINLATATARRYSNKVSQPVHDFFYQNEGLGLYTLTTRFGTKKDGKPFRPLQPAVRAQVGSAMPADLPAKAKAMDGHVIQVDPNDVEKGFLIEVNHRLDTSPLVGAAGADPNSIGLLRQQIGKYLASSANQDIEEFTAQAFMAEAGHSGFAKVIEPQLKALRGLNNKSKHALSAVYTELRDGAHAHLRRGLNRLEFDTTWMTRHADGTLPTDKDWDAYQALADIEKADYMLKGTTLVRKFVERGFSQALKLVVGKSSPAKEVGSVTDIPINLVDKIYDGTAKGAWQPSVSNGVLPQTRLWKLESPLEEGGRVYTHAVHPRDVRVVEITDLLGYNPGGSRMDKRLSHFIINASGEVIKTVLSARSLKEATAAAAQLNTIRIAIRDGLPNIDDIIQRNNGWNDSINTLAEFRAHMLAHGLDESTEFAVKGKNDKIVKELGDNSAYSGMNWSDYVAVNSGRSDSILPTYGGGTHRFEDPINSILSQFTNSSHAIAHAEYTQKLTVGWVKTLQDETGEWLPQVAHWFSDPTIPKDDYLRLFMSANIKNVGDDPFLLKHAELRDIGMRRLGLRDETGLSMQRFGRGIAEFVYDTSMSKWIPGAGFKPNIGDPVNNLLSIGYMSAFGFFNPAQFFVQSQHVIAIAAMSPEQGMKGGLMAIPMKILFTLGDGPTRTLLKQRMTKLFGLTDEQMFELEEFLRTSGRPVIDGNAIQEGTGVGFKSPSYQGANYNPVRSAAVKAKDTTKSILEAGMLPFKAGEGMGRFSGILTASLEYMKKNPGATILDDQARRAITTREQILTMHMTGASKGKLQQGLGKLPMQWMTFSMRALEALFVGKGMSVAERARLFTAMAPFYGLYGVGAQGLAVELSEMFGIEPGSTEFQALKGGVFDGLSHWALGDSGPAISKRLAPIQGITDMISKLVEDGAIEAAGGPSVEITSGAIGNLYRGLMHFKSDRPNLGWESIKRVAETAGGVSAKFKAYKIMEYQTYVSSTGSEIGAEQNQIDAIIAGLGFGNLERQELWAASQEFSNETKNFKAFKKEANNSLNAAFRLLDTGNQTDQDKAFAMIGEVRDQIELFKFPYRQNKELMELLVNPLSDGDRLRNLLKIAIERDNKHNQKIITDIMNNGDNE